MEENRWRQVVQDRFWGRDSAMAFSWQNISIQPGETVPRMAVLKFGLPYMNNLTLSLDQSRLPQDVANMDSFDLTAYAASDNHHANVSIFIAADYNYSNGQRLPGPFPVNQVFTFTVTVQTFGFGPGVHEYLVCAVDDVGTISNGFFLTTDSRAKSRTWEYVGIAITTIVVVIIVAVVGIFIWRWKRAKEHEEGVNIQQLLEQSDNVPA
jgi:hypothetical protein